MRVVFFGKGERGNGRNEWKNGMEEWNGRKTEETSRCECLGFQDVANAVGRQEVVRLKLTARLKGV